jgi:hypothetical protein
VSACRTPPASAQYFGQRSNIVIDNLMVGFK